MELSPSIIAAVWALIRGTLEQVGHEEDFDNLPAVEQAKMLSCPTIRSYLQDVVEEALQSEVNRLTEQ